MANPLLKAHFTKGLCKASFACSFAENLDVEGAGVLSQGEAKLKESKEVYRLLRRSNENTKTLAT